MQFATSSQWARRRVHVRDPVGENRARAAGDDPRKTLLQEHAAVVAMIAKTFATRQTYNVACVRRPLVGITTYVVPARWSHWELEAALVPADYVRAVERAGGRALLVPPSADGVDETLDAVDGLVFSGGADLDPALYGQERHAETVGIVEERDRAELALLNGALARDMPVLAICRGAQVLNVARGGDLVQHLPEVVGDDKHRHTPGTFADHDVTLEGGTQLARILGERAPVKSHHHQGIGRVAAGLRVAAHAEDRTIEAVEDPSHPFALGVLWHPEADEDMKLFEELVRQAGEYRAGR